MRDFVKSTEKSKHQRTQAQGVREWGAEEDILALRGRG